MDEYKIVRLYKDVNKPKKTIKTGLTLEEAQTHARDPKTHGVNWFDGYEKVIHHHTKRQRLRASRSRSRKQR